MKKLISVFVFVFVFVNVNVSVINAQTLFHIARNLNKNVINYDVRLNKGALDKKDPLHVYWYNLEKNPATTNELNFIQRKLAYGYKTLSASVTEAVVKLKAYNNRAIRIVKYRDQWVAVISISGQNCILQEIYAHCPSKTSCDYIELRGRNLQTGQPMNEKIKN